MVIITNQIAVYSACFSLQMSDCQIDCHLLRVDRLSKVFKQCCRKDLVLVAEAVTLQTKRWPLVAKFGVTSRKEKAAVAMVVVEHHSKIRT